MNNRVRTAALALIAIGTLHGTAMAGFEAGFIGNSQFIFEQPPNQSTTVPLADGIVNFAVFNAQQGSSNAFSSGAAILGSGRPAYDANATYVYAYQLVNTDPITPDSPLLTLSIPLPQGSGTVTSVGFLANAVFNEAVEGLTGPVANPRLGPNSVALTDDVPGNGVPSFPNATLVAGSEIGALASLSPLVASVLPNSINFSFVPPLDTAFFSSIFYFTSNLPPEYAPFSTVSAGVFNTSADIPVPNPEPATLISAFGAVACGLVALGVRRRRGA